MARWIAGADGVAVGLGCVAVGYFAAGDQRAAALAVTLAAIASAVALELRRRRRG